MGKRRIVVALVAFPLLAACGSDGGGVATLKGGRSSDRGAASPSVDPEEALVEWSRCMREHGVDVPDPQVGGGGDITFGVPVGGGGSDGGDVRSAIGGEEFQEADGACRHLLPEGGPLGRELSAEEQAELQDAALEWARCMRDHGIEVPDPEFGEGGGTAVRIGDAGFDPSDSAFLDAQEACGMPLEEVAP